MATHSNKEAQKPHDTAGSDESDEEIDESFMLDNVDESEDEAEESANEEETIRSLTGERLQLKPREVLRHAKEKNGWDLAQVRKDFSE